MSVHVIKVEFKASVGGIDLPVQAATIVNASNAIPKIELKCAPTESEGQGVNVKIPRISEYEEIYRKLSKMAHGLEATGNISIKVIDAETKEEDNVDLNNWILSGVGLSSVCTTSSPVLVVIMQHPICKLTKLGGIYEYPREKIDKKICRCSGEKYTDLVGQVYDIVAKGSFWKTFCEKKNGIASIFRTSLGDSVNKPATYLRDDTKTFLAPYIGGLKQRMQAAEALMGLPRFDSQSTWDKLLQACGAMIISVIQDESDNFTTPKLVLAPTEPWKTPEINIEDSICESFDLPGMDPFMICGVMADKPCITGFQVDSGTVDKTPGKANKTTHGPSCVLYAPDPATPSISDGRIMKVPCPRLLSMAHSNDASYGSKVLSGGTVKGVDVYRQDYEKQLVKYCQACYENTCRSMVRTKINTKLTFRDSNKKLILPGYACTLKSKGDVIYYGYIQQVVQDMDTRGRCSTVISLSHVRKDGDYKIGKSGQTAIKLGSRNPIYYNN